MCWDGEDILMNKNEQDMIRKIKEKSGQVPVPKALEPRQIEAKLAGKKKKVWTPARISGWQPHAWC